MAQVLSTLADEIQGLAIVRPTSVSGRVSRFDGHIIECDGFPATIGTLCEIDTPVSYTHLTLPTTPYV